MQITGTSSLADAVVRYTELAASIEETSKRVRFHKVVSATHELIAAVTAHLDLLAADEIHCILQPVRDLLLTSPFAARLIEWPRGYPGDFATIEYLAKAQNRAPADTFAWFFEQYALNSMPAQQHRNKLAWQTDQIRHQINQKPDSRIFSIACGSCLDFIPVGHLLQAARIKINDQDTGAIHAATQNLSPFVLKIETEIGNVLRTVAREQEQSFDLIIAGGLFDYLNDRAARLLVSQLKNLLIPGGKLCFTNIGDDNVFKPWMDHCVNWQLIGRSVQELQALVGGWPVGIESDLTGLTWLITVTAPSR